MLALEELLRTREEPLLTLEARQSGRGGERIRDAPRTRRGTRRHHASTRRGTGRQSARTGRRPARIRLDPRLSIGRFLVRLLRHRIVPVIGEEFCKAIRGAPKRHSQRDPDRGELDEFIGAETIDETRMC